MADRAKKPPIPINKRAVAEGAKSAVQGNNVGQAFDRFVDELRKRLLINQEPEDTFEAGVQAERHWRDDLCPSGENHGLGPWIPPPKPRARKLSEPGELVEFEEHHVALFQKLTAPVADALGRFAVRLARREAALGWVTERWKSITGCVLIGWGWAMWGHDKLPQIKAGLEWLLAHLS